jgi:hypothetical protein
MIMETMNKLWEFGPFEMLIIAIISMVFMLLFIKLADILLKLLEKIGIMNNIIFSVDSKRNKEHLPGDIFTRLPKDIGVGLPPHNFTNEVFILTESKEFVSLRSGVVFPYDAMINRLQFIGRDMDMEIKVYE